MDSLLTADYFDHEADIGVIGRGTTVEHALEGAARAMFAIMTDISALPPQVTVKFDFEEADAEFALVTWLNLLLAHARTRQAAFGQFHLRRRGNIWHGEASGAFWNGNMERGVEVKGATLTMLRVRQQGNSWEARCVVDV